MPTYYLLYNLVNIISSIENSDSDSDMLRNLGLDM